MAERFEHHARLMTVLTLVSRVTGLVRDAALARVFGVGPLMDAFNLAFLIPNLFRRLFGEGAISAAFVPRYAELERDDPAQARRYSGLLLALLAAVLWGIVIVGELFLLSRWLASPPIEFTRTPPMMFAGVMVESMSVSYVRLGYELTALMLPYMPLVCLTAVAGSALQVHGRFGPTAASPIILNIALIAATLGVLPLVSLIAVVKAGDVLAYVVGSLIGRTKMAPVLSPGKTWEGAVGSLAGSLLASWLIFEKAGFATEARPLGGWIVFGLVVGIAGMLGDLAESLVKRELGAKDSGRLLGGLGGVLDLIDSLAFAAPIAWLLWAA